MGFDKIRSIVEVDLVDGRMFVQPSDERYRGSPAWPFTIAELRERFADCASPLLVEGSHSAGARPDRVGGEDQGHPRAHPYPDRRMIVDAWRLKVPWQMADGRWQNVRKAAVAQGFSPAKTMAKDFLFERDCFASLRLCVLCVETWQGLWGLGTGCPIPNPRTLPS